MELINFFFLILISALGSNQRTNCELQGKIDNFHYLGKVSNWKDAAQKSDKKISDIRKCIGPRV